MTTTKAINISSYSFNKTDSLFVDANVWMYIYYTKYPTKEIGFQRAYTREFEKMIENNCKIHLDAMVLSEFMNRFAKKEWEREIPVTMREKMPFKEFRNG